MKYLIEVSETDKNLQEIDFILYEIVNGNPIIDRSVYVKVYYQNYNVGEDIYMNDIEMEDVVIEGGQGNFFSVLNYAKGNITLDFIKDILNGQDYSYINN